VNFQLPSVTFEPDEQFKKKKRKVNLLTILVDSTRSYRKQSVPAQVASGETIFTLGNTGLELNLGGTTINHTVFVLPTTAFQAVEAWTFSPNPPALV